MAPEPNGMDAIFYQTFWKVVGKSTTAIVLQALNTSEFLNFLNHTFTTLISKKKSFMKVVDYKPISLCNVIYKLISKVIANRLKKLLLVIISDVQNAFVPEKLIINNVLVAYEIIDYLRQKKVGKKRIHIIKTRLE